MSKETMKEVITSYKTKVLNLGYTEKQAEMLIAILLEMFINEPNIEKHILRDVEYSNYGWYVQSDIDAWSYLHTDGKIHNSTEYAGEWTGYFKTEQEALDAKSKYESK